MADKPDAELEQMAFEIFKDAVARNAVQRGAEQVAIDAYRKAALFIAVRDKVRNGELKTAVAKVAGPQLADACCPNQRRTHPHNLIAGVYTDKSGKQHPGDLQKVSRIAGFLAKNPPSQDRSEADVATAVNGEFGLDWNADEVKTARQIFPAYVKAEAVKN